MSAALELAEELHEANRIIDDGSVRLVCKDESRMRSGLLQFVRTDRCRHCTSQSCPSLRSPIRTRKQSDELRPELRQVECITQDPAASLETREHRIRTLATEVFGALLVCDR